MNLTNEELYVLEKVCDEHRDKVMLGVAEYCKLAETSSAFKKTFKEEGVLDKAMSYFQTMQSICSKLQEQRLKRMSV